MNGSLDDSANDTPIVRLGNSRQGSEKVHEHVVSNESFPVLIRVWLKAYDDKTPEGDAESLSKWLMFSNLAGKSLKEIAEAFVATAFLGRINAVEVKKSHAPTCGYLIYPEWP
jgi:hypothetical protein